MNLPEESFSKCHQYDHIADTPTHKKENRCNSMLVSNLTSGYLCYLIVK